MREDVGREEWYFGIKEGDFVVTTIADRGLQTGIVGKVVQRGFRPLEDDSLPDVVRNGIVVEEIQVQVLPSYVDGAEEPCWLCPMNVQRMKLTNEMKKRLWEASEDDLLWEQTFGLPRP